MEKESKNIKNGDMVLKPLRLLIVEDSQNDADLVIRELKRGGFEPKWKRVENAHDMDEALEAESWDIIISDFKMPNFTGLDALYLLQKKNIDIPFIIASGTIGEETAVAVMKTGASDYLMKDNLSRLPSAVERELRDAEGRRAREKAETKLRESETLFRTLTKMTPTGIYLTDPKGNCIYANEKWLEVAGMKLEEALGDGWIKAIHPDDRDNVIDNWNKMVESKGKWSLEYRFQTASGKTTTILGLATELRDDNGNITGYVGTNIDITESKQLEDRLRQSEKMEAIGQLAGGIAHDFNNQLAGIMGYAEMLVERLDDKNLRDYAENIMRASRRASDLTRDLLAFSRKGKIRTVPVNMHKLIEEVVSILERSIDKKIEIRRILKASPASIMGDPSQLQNALLNIAINARDAMPNGGELTFSTETMRFLESPLRTDFKNNESLHCLKISVSDSGTGMDKNTLKHIFEPFFTTKETGKGVGMGLPSAYGTVKNHHGLINVDSELGRGTVFTLYFPVTEDVPENDKNEKGDIPVTRTVNILLVEDEEIVCNLVEGILKSFGHKVVVCRDGSEALEMYRNIWNDIDLVILDMIMPKMGGKDTFVAMKKINPGVKALLSSGYSIDGEAQKIIDEGARGFIQKPFNMRELSDKIREIIGNV